MCHITFHVNKNKEKIKKTMCDNNKYQTKVSETIGRY